VNGPSTKPVLFVTGHAPGYRIGALARLHEQEGIELALFGGRSKHGGEVFTGEMPFPHRHVRPHELAGLASSGSYRAVVCPTGGRLAPRAPSRSAAHALSYLPLRRLYGSADAVVTYGPHVSAYVQARGARNVFVAPQAVDNDFWSAPDVAPPSDPAWPASASVRFLFAGRAAPEKGIDVLAAAWRAAELHPPAAALVLAGVDPSLSAIAPAGPRRQGDAGLLGLGTLSATAMRDVYAACDVLVLPSLATRTFREPWGLVANEAMNRGLPVIASDAVGAAAGGLVRDGVNGLVVAAGDSTALAHAIVRLAEDTALRARLGEQAAIDVRGYTYGAWADGFSQGLASVGVSRKRW
jgi:glycosyltransferase involved in cell wall biosynthesis